jgi:glycosyltransferase involved in cell wall biosynthesis
MNPPLVSVCLPNLNTQPFLAERYDCIAAQTLSDWELVVSDNYSDDGSWEFFQELARKDPRVLIAQAPREGLYPNWNRCVERARGKYVYIATSDDTMAPDCLEKMVAALEQHPGCDLALCPLVVIDEEGQTLDQPRWPEANAFSHDVGDLLNRTHIRRAPYDGFLHLMGQNIYTSITQLVIRRTLFERTGPFSGAWGSVGDFHWDMKASLLANTVYVPSTWASWRVHSRQATAFQALMSPEHRRKVDEMIGDAFKTCEPHLPPAIASGLRDHWIEWSRDMREYYGTLRDQDVSRRRAFQLGQMLSGTNAARSQILGQLTGKPKWTEVGPSEMRQWLESQGLGPMVHAAASDGSSRDGQ